ncbi:unnamed protein product [Toxocara canis]|uniref:Reverse transcriptase n=1 Tax=Toxocara canis TaxID=6265 RepID=A0A183TX81_TOXCA|nr:unnamed protein product [Toxocara canis]
METILKKKEILRINDSSHSVNPVLNNSELKATQHAIDSPPSKLRRFLWHNTTTQDRNLRQQAGKLSAQANMLKYVVHDLRIVTLKSPRELPPRKMYPTIILDGRANSCQISSMPNNVSLSPPLHPSSVEATIFNGIKGFGLNCIYFNAQSMVNKLPELKLLADSRAPDGILISETWLTDPFPDSLLSLQSTYRVFRCDRVLTKKEGGGGVAILTRLGLSVTFSEKHAFFL